MGAILGTLGIIIAAILKAGKSKTTIVYNTHSSSSPTPRRGPAQLKIKKPKIILHKKPSLLTQEPIEAEYTLTPPSATNAPSAQQNSKVIQGNPIQCPSCEQQFAHS